jgi:DMSO/TMAO reductase YedYZ molybdopterin-dependent catalytic subunit
MSGVKLAEVLDRAGVQSKTVQLVFYGRDGYSESVPIDHARRYGLLVYAMNGVLLPEAHGAPVKVEVPGLYGFKNMKWLTRIVAVDTPYQSVWTQEGWTSTAVYQTMSRIDVIAPRKDGAGHTIGVTIAGIAFAGVRGISQVEVQINEGNWQPAILNAPPISDLTWTQWQIESPAQGQVTVSVRATDGSGVLQTAEAHPQFPNGATGWHSLTMTV